MCISKEALTRLMKQYKKTQKVVAERALKRRYHFQEKIKTMQA
jgi:hypothetical protein